MYLVRELEIDEVIGIKEIENYKVLYYLYSSPSDSTLVSLQPPLQQLPTFDTTYQTPSDHARAPAFD